MDDGSNGIEEGETVEFEVQSPAQQPAPPGPPIPDASPSYSGNGSFVTTNTKLTGT